MSLHPHRYLFATALLSASIAARAQYTPLYKYELSNAVLQEVMLDHIQDYCSTLLDAGNGQYVGQISTSFLLYGYGRYVSNDGMERIGLFRDGQFVWGITLGGANATVGGQDYYASYSLTTGKLEYIYHSQERQLVNTDGQHEYAFVSMRYQNGDQYVGEIYQRRRHGYGIYYYANGDIWMGSYHNDVRSGYGVLFHEDNTMTIGHWEGEDTPRIVDIKPLPVKGRKK